MKFTKKIIFSFFLCLLPVLGITESFQSHLEESSRRVSDLIHTETVSSRPYFIARQKEVKTKVSFKLHPVYESSNITSPPKRGELTILDNAFYLEYNVITQNTVQGTVHTFTYDNLLRLREIRRQSSGEEVLRVAFKEDGGLASIWEISDEGLVLSILFNAFGQVEAKTISFINHVWQYHYRYHSGRLARVTSLHNGMLMSDRVMTWEAGSEGREINRIDELDIQGRKLRSWEIERDLTLARGEGVENIRRFTTYGKSIEETFRIWSAGRVVEDYVFRNQFYQRILYHYDSHGLLESKITLDNSQKVVAQHHYQYQLPFKERNLVFLEFLKLNTLETSQYLLGERIQIEEKKVFHLKNLVTSSHEELFQGGDSIMQKSFVGGLDTLSSESSNSFKKIIIAPESGSILSDREIRYDDYGRIQEIFLSSYQAESSGNPKRTRFFYQESTMAKLKDPIPPRMERYFLGPNYLNYFKKRQEENLKKAPPTLEQQFQAFSTDKGAEGSYEEHLLSHLEWLRATGLRKIIAYNRQGQVDYYYRVEQKQLSPDVKETYFTFYPQPPKIDLMTSRLQNFLGYSNRYTIPGFTSPLQATNSSDYRYLHLGGRKEFHHDAIDNILPSQEKPLETIIVQFNGKRLLESRQILYNPFTYKPEKEVTIRDRETKVRSLQ